MRRELLVMCAVCVLSLAPFLAWSSANIGAGLLAPVGVAVGFCVAGRLLAKRRQSSGRPVGGLFWIAAAATVLVVGGLALAVSALSQDPQMLGILFGLFILIPAALIGTAMGVAIAERLKS